MKANVRTTVVLVAIWSAAVAAQQSGGAPQTPAEAPGAAVAKATSDQIDALKPKIRIFEQLVIEAVDSGGQRFAQWAKTIANVELQPVVNPTVSSVYLPETGSLAFIVQVPEIRPTAVAIWQMRQREQQERGAGATTAAQRVGAQGLVQADPMAPLPPAQPATGCQAGAGPSDANRVYSDCVKDALYNVLLDGSQVLPIADGQSLTLQANPFETAGANPLYLNQSRKLILSVKGEDLRAMREGRITRDDLRQRIVELHF